LFLTFLGLFLELGEGLVGLVFFAAAFLAESLVGGMIDCLVMENL